MRLNDLHDSSLKFGACYSLVFYRREVCMLWQDLQRIRAEAPLVHNITNYVVMNTTANSLLAIGASPVMAHAIEEVADMVGIARALVLNIGTLSTPWIDAMFAAGEAARRRSLPIVLDPVGSGATPLRTATAARLVREIRPTIIRGNASEIRSLVFAEQGTKGVDSMHRPEETLEAAHALSETCGSTVVVSGAVDLIVTGSQVIRVANGHPMMPRVTGLGCAATALTGAFAAVNPSPADAAANAMALMGIAGEIAGERSAGPGSFQVNFLDALYLIRETDIKDRLQMRVG
jgi:hydroxyethylthiazole kinase